MDFQKINDVYKIILDKCELDKSWRWMSPDTLEAFDWLIDEINEAKEEYNNKKQVYLEDELWDVLWTVLRMIELIHQEWFIDKNRILERIEKKFSKRTYGLRDWLKWADIKKEQKIELKKEQDLLDNL